MSVKPLDEAHKKALIKLSEDFLEKLELNPDLCEKVIAGSKRFVERYGVLSNGASFGGLWDNDCSSYVRDLLSLSDRYGRPLRIIVEPEPRPYR